MTDTIASGPVIPASLRQPVLTRLATITPPATLLTAVAQAQSSEGAPAFELPTPAEAAEPIFAVDGVVEEGEVDDSMGLPELESKEAGEESVSPVGGQSILTVPIKLEY